MREPIAASGAPESQSEIDLTPMLDVVFIMLIFFLVVASFTKEHGLDLDQADPTLVSVPDADSIAVSIEKDNRIWIDKRPVDPRAVRANLNRLLVERPQATVVIQADKRSANKTLVQVMDASRQAGIYKLSLSSQPPDDVREPVQQEWQ